jgi:hypothetical protein
MKLKERTTISVPTLLELGRLTARGDANLYSLLFLKGSVRIVDRQR